MNNREVREDLQVLIESFEIRLMEEFRARIVHFRESPSPQELFNSPFLNAEDEWFTKLGQDSAMVLGSFQFTRPVRNRPVDVVEDNRTAWAGIVDDPSGWRGPRPGWPPSSTRRRWRSSSSGSLAIRVSIGPACSLPEPGALLTTRPAPEAQKNAQRALWHPWYRESGRCRSHNTAGGL